MDESEIKVSKLSAISELTEAMVEAQTLDEVMRLIVSYFKSEGFSGVHIASPLEQNGDDQMIIEQDDSWFIPFKYEGSHFMVRVMKPEMSAEQAKKVQLSHYRTAVDAVLKLKSSVREVMSLKTGQAAHDINGGLSVILINLGIIKVEGLVSEMELVDDSLESARRIQAAVATLQGRPEVCKKKVSKLTQKEFEVFMEGKTILHIEDEEAIRTIALRVCGKDNVESVASGEKGLKKLKEGLNPDMIICDMVMPGMSGKQVYEQVKENHPELLDRFCFFTGGGGADPALREFLEDTKVFIIDKPLGPEKLRSKVVEFFRLKSD